MYTSLWKEKNIIDKIDLFCMNLVANAFNNIFFKEKQHLLKQDFLNIISISPVTKKFFSFLMDTLLYRDYIQLHDEKYFMKSNSALALEYIDKLYSQLTNYTGILEIVIHCTKNYSRLLANEILGVQILFPNGSFDFLHQQLVIKTKNHSNVYNYISYIIEIINAREKNLVIFEVGAGNGDITWKIIDFIKNKTEKYYYSDISRLFILDAMEQAERYNYNLLKFMTLDIMATIPNNLHNEADIVIIYNVLHATSNVDIALKNIKRILKPNGLLFMIELHNPFFWQHCVWGVLDGWWHFDDAHRTTIPTLSIEKWTHALLINGFEIHKIFPESDLLEKEVDTCMFIARSVSTN